MSFAKRITTRRGFVKEAVTGAAGAAVAGSLASWESAATAAQPARAENVFSAQAAGRPGKNKLKIDIFCHILPPKYLAAYAKKNKIILDQVEAKNRGCTDIDYRIQIMDKSPDVLQVLTISNPPIDKFVGSQDAPELAKIANDELAELLAKYPKRFAGAIACVSMNNIDAALKETDRAIKMGFKGIQMGTRVSGESINQPQFKPLWEKMAKYDLPIWIHPVTYDKLDRDNGVFSWPFETSMTMYHLVSTGVFTDHPNIKFITHHCGGMLPYFETRTRWADNQEHFRKFYGDTALMGNTSALMCGYAYLGADHILFGTDAPFGPTGDTISSVERMNIPEVEKEKIFSQNAIKLLRLSL